MALTVLHTGQTGVERGADRAARLVGLAVEGVCSTELRDEMGLLPLEIRNDLQPCPLRGARNAMRATLARAGGLVVAVPDARAANDVAGIEPLRRGARASGIPTWVVDPTANLDEVIAQVRELEAHGPLRLMITGPRLTRWHVGEKFGWRIVAQLSMHPGLAVAHKHRVLVVDDQPEVVETACSFVQALGHSCIAANDGASALRVAREFDPDVALLDIRLPDVSGYEVARRLRAQHSHPLFLAAITGWADELGPSKALDAGFDRHIVKPATGAVIRQLLSDATDVLTNAA